MKVSDKFSYELNLCLNTRCNYCRETCSVYEVSKMEFDSPRAKLELINEVLQDRVDPKEIMSILNRCTSCKKCVESCPYGIDVSDMLDEFRNLVKKQIKDEHEFIVKTGYPRGYVDNFIKKGNPLGGKILENEIPENFDFYFFPGCVGNFEDPELVEKTKKIFEKLDLKFATINYCCFNGLHAYSISKDEIKGLFKRVDVSRNKKVVCICASCYDALKNLHGKNVVFITDFLQSHLKKLKLKNLGNVTYQDPCHIGRYNKIYESPRKILESIDGLKFIEMNEIKENAPCCGGGGSLKHADRDIAGKVAKKVIEKTPKDTNIITSCTFCKYNLNKNSDREVKHIIDLIFESVN